MNWRKNKTSLSDEEVIANMKKGDEKALEYLYLKNYRMLSHLVIKNSGTEDEAKDIIQETLIVFWQKIISNKLELTSKISTYLYSVCFNLWRKELDRKRRLSFEEKDGEDTQDHDAKEQSRLVIESINKLGETCQKVLTMYYFDGLSMNDIADILGFSNSDTAKTKKYKCKKELDLIIRSEFTKEDLLD